MEKPKNDSPKLNHGESSEQPDTIELDEDQLEQVSGGMRKAGEGQKDFLQVNTTRQPDPIKPPK